MDTKNPGVSLTTEQIDYIIKSLYNRYGDDMLPIEEIRGFLKEEFINVQPER